MQIQINTDANIEADGSLADHVRGVVESALGRFDDRITRIEVHLSDENGHKNSADDKRCAMEARLKGHQPMGVTHHAETLNQAIDGAAGKLRRSLESTIEKLSEHR